MALSHVGANHYSLHSNPVRKWTREVVEQYLKEGKLSRKYSRVLDLGCGTGENTQFLAEKIDADHVTAVDQHPGFLRHAQRHCSDERIEFMETDINKPAWTSVCEDKKYDLVSSFFFLHWNTDNEKLLQQMSEIMEENGESFHVFGIQPDERFLHTMKQLLYHKNWSDYFENFKSAPEWMARVKQTNTWGSSTDPASAMRSILERAGHEVITCSTKKVSYRAESLRECRGMLQWLLPITRYIPHTKVDAFMNDAMTLFEQNTSSPENLNLWATTIMIVHTRLSGSSSSINSSTTSLNSDC